MQKSMAAAPTPAPLVLAFDGLLKTLRADAARPESVEAAAACCLEALHAFECLLRLAPPDHTLRHFLWLLLRKAEVDPSRESERQRLASWLDTCEPRGILDEACASLSRRLL